MGNIELEKMSTADKFLLLEELWQDLSKNVEEKNLSPDWHFEVLNEREKGVKEGKNKFLDFEDVKKQIGVSRHLKTNLEI